MSNLKDLIENLKLPVKVRYHDWLPDVFFEVHSKNNLCAIGFNQDESPDYQYFCDDPKWSVYTEQTN
jgi:hypothetical protein